MLPLAAAILMLSACASHTSVQSRWHDTGHKRPGFERVLVVGVSEDTDRRMSFEDAVVFDLRAAGIDAWSSTRLMPSDAAINEDNLRSLVETQNADAVVVTKVTKMEVVPVESGGRTDVMEFKQETGNEMVPQRRSGTIFQYDYVENVEPIYVTTEYTTELTTDVYDTRDGSHVYTVVTSAKKKETLAEVVDVLSDEIAARLTRDKVIG